MNTFFSGTDMQDMHDNTENFGLYISLIVNFDGNWQAKGGFIAKTETVVTANDFNIKLPKRVEEKTLITFDFILDFEEENWMYDRIQQVEEQKKARLAAQKLVNSRQNTVYSNYHNRGANTFIPKVNKQISIEEFLDDSANEFFPGFGNIYTDHTTGIHYSDGGDVISEQDYKGLKELYAE